MHGERGYCYLIYGVHCKDTVQTHMAILTNRLDETLMYQRLLSISDPVKFTFEGQTLTAQAGESVAAALLASNVESFRDTPVSHSLRSPFCMMGSCFDCLVEIDGQPNCQACMTEVRDGMEIYRQRGEA